MADKTCLPRLALVWAKKCLYNKSVLNVRKKT